MRRGGLCYPVCWIFYDSSTILDMYALLVGMTNLAFCGVQIFEASMWLDEAQRILENCGDLSE